MITPQAYPEALAAIAFFEWGGQRGPRHFRGQVYRPMVANNALSWDACPIFNFFPSSSAFPLISLFLFASCGSLPFPLFDSHLLPLPSFHTARGLGERCKLSQARSQGAWPLEYVRPPELSSLDNELFVLSLLFLFYPRIYYDIL